MGNRVTLAQFAKMDEASVKAIAVVDLALLQEELTAEQARVKKLADRFGAELKRRFSEQAQDKRRAAGQDTGTVRFIVDDVEVKADLPKKPEWDQAELRKALETVKSWGENPDEYVTTELSVPEKTYGAWPSTIKKVFDPARTLKTGSPKFTLALNEAA